MTKKNMRYSLLLATIAACIYFLFFGQRGIIKYCKLAEEIKHEKNRLEKLEQKNENLKNKIKQWEKDDFEKEKFARQELQMSRADEMIFVTTQMNSI